MPLDDHDFECVASLVDSYFKAAIAERDAEIDKLKAQVAALQAGREISVSHVSDFLALADLCDPYAKLPQTRARHRLESNDNADETPVAPDLGFPDLSDLCDPYGKLPQTRARRRQQSIYDAHRMRGYIGEPAFARIMRSTGADPTRDIGATNRPASQSANRAVWSSLVRPFDTQPRQPYPAMQRSFRRQDRVINRGTRDTMTTAKLTLFRYMDEEYCERMVADGEIRIKTSTEYRDGTGLTEMQMDDEQHKTWTSSPVQSGT